MSIALLAAPVASSFGQGNCQNVAQYPSNSIVPDALGALTTISTCSFQSEYSVVTNINAGAAYQFTFSLGGYITVRQDTPGGPVIGQGYSPVTVNAVTSGDLFPHWTVDDACNQLSSCGVSTVQLFLNCTPPTASISVLDDCPNNSFTADVNITSLGDGAFVNIVYSVNGGPFTTLSGLGLGLQTLGPFVVGDVVNILVEHESDPACNVNFNGVVSTGVCPTILTCGGAELNENYCYGPNDSQSWWYQTTGNDPIALLFSAGTIESSVFDNLTIYDGPNNTSPILFDHQGGTFDLTGTLAVSTGNNLFMEMSSDGSVQCSTNTTWEWFWTVGCLDCDIPAATFEVVEDC
ncbi:MAG: hypothetical protein KDB88_04310, partial [Flavobacteriales bacterium]|nr:hypothetical protein [Flavobacteriales bacterium]